MVKKIWNQTRSVCRGRGGELLDTMLLQIMIRLLALSPLLFLLSGKLKILACLSALFYLTLIPQLRRNSAGAMQRMIRGGPLFSASLVSFRDWGRHFLESARTGACLFLWALPFIGSTAWILRVIYGKAIVGQTDVFSVMTALQNLGGGDVMRGTAWFLFFYALTLIPLVLGISFHSGRRHEQELGEKRFLKGYRSRVLKVWWCGILLLIPFLGAVGFSAFRYARAIMGAVNNMATEGLRLPAPDQSIYLALAAFLVLYLPFQPFRSLLSACCVHDLWEGRES